MESRVLFKSDEHETYINACKDGDIDKAILMLNKQDITYSFGFYMACRYGRIELIKLLVDKVENCINSGLINSCYYGYMNLVKFFIEKGANGVIDFDQGLIYACEGGHIEIIELMISHGAKSFNVSLQRACFAGYVDIVKLMISYGANNLQDVLNDIYYAYNSSFNNNKETLITVLILKLGVIPDLTPDLSKEQLYLLYKSGVIPSFRYKRVFDSLRQRDDEISRISDDIFISDLLRIIVSY